jgi:hypothetical protein
MPAQKQFFLRRGESHFWASELPMILRTQQMAILGKEGF